MKRIIIAILLCALCIPRVVHARSVSVSVSNNEVEINFPTSILFKADLQSTQTITKVKLHYGTNQETCGNVSSIAFPEIKPAKLVSAQWEWDMRLSGGEPPGATIWWQWEIVDAQGGTQLTERKEITWIDDAHPWKKLEEGLIRLHYYYSDESYGESLKDAAITALERLGQDIGIVPDQPVDLYIYQSTQDLQDAVFYEPGWTGGLAYPEYNIVIIGIDPLNLDWGKDTEAHELTHVLEGNYTFSCFGSTPTWLSEGLAVYGEGGPRTEWITLFNQNRRADSLLSFKVLSGGFSEDPAVADLSYSQSYYMVNYLIQNYDKEKMLGLLSALKSAGELNDSLQAVYGFDLAGFENEWRASLDLPPAKTIVEQNTPVPTIIPTIVPIQGGQPQSAVTTTQDEIVVEHTAETPQPSFFQDITSYLRSILIWIVACATAILVLLIVLLIVMLKKGDRK